MDEFLLVMTVLVCLSMNAVMTWLTFFDHRYETIATEADAIKKLLAQFDELETQAEPRLFAA
ncbi:hypothetical protein [Mycobacterium sp.]|uniref:hypothetical protein n=1 Tax=Mycobacterium sp. TaxID=1785 RepID=UPI0025E686E1|nr:hypothetical protein [Mycobacterium sp.]